MRKKCQSENLEEDKQLKGKGVDVSIILKWVLEIRWDCADWDGISDELFWTE